MPSKNISSAAFADTKPHYELLDGLRGVAALLVVLYHIYEGFSFGSGGAPISIINHGYLAVDFFFMLSGFVIGYAYDDRWNKNLTTGNFFKRRLIRLHPMIVAGAVTGAITFMIQGSVQWDGTKVATSAVMMAMLCAILFIPAIPGAGYEVRGSGEMFPLNGPAWSLFFEYIGNILYALFIRRLPFKALVFLTAITGCGLAWFALSDVVGYGMIGSGWALEGLNFPGGLLRMLFPFTLGMLISRKFRPVKVKGAFWICSVTLAVLFCVPYIEGKSPVCLNGIYEMFCIAIVFPILVWLGASGRTTDRASSAVCKFLGDISYPLYAIHYPIMYLFFSWLIKNSVFTLAETWHVAVPVYIGSIALAYILLKVYDEPVRKLLGKRFIDRK